MHNHLQERRCVMLIKGVLLVIVCFFGYHLVMDPDPQSKLGNLIGLCGAGWIALLIVKREAVRAFRKKALQVLGLLGSWTSTTELRKRLEERGEYHPRDLLTRMLGVLERQGFLICRMSDEGIALAARRSPDPDLLFDVIEWKVSSRVGPWGPFVR